MSDYLLCYRILNDVCRDGAYSNAALSRALEEADNGAWLTRMVYGVLSREITLDYYIDALASKSPKAQIRILLRMGIYQLAYMDGTPDYAAVHTCVQACAQIGKPALKGFVNAVLQAFVRNRPLLPDDPIRSLGVRASLPTWLTRMLTQQYGYDCAERFLTAPSCDAEHVRHNPRKTTAQDAEQRLARIGGARPDGIGGWYVRNTPQLRKLFDRGIVTIQSETSVRCCMQLDARADETILDACAAPGGKSVYLSERARKVVACELHPHRARLIEAYARRMGADNIETVCADMTRPRPDWNGMFDAVLCDVPCSGLGVRAKKPELVRNLSPETLDELHDVQFAILQTCSAYVAPNGRLVYATCTVTERENGAVIQRFLLANPQWKCVSQTQYLPDGSGKDGFFVARLERTA